ncbi:hypothetical protein [Agromyces lapidis]|uniref:SAV-6107-like HEPN domain-containing protein n=1 Tax=Agromyces lapidis TaxID=279574 RepID=A0ABV5SLW4_9MICO|nr:hypothetical protein [Agromyces lapidis]
MGFDSSRTVPTAPPAHVPSTATAAALELAVTSARLTVAARDRLERTRFLSDVKELELRLAIFDDRFERLAARPDEPYQAWRRDLVGRIRSLAQKAADLEAAALLEPHHRDRVAALLLTLRHRLEALDARHAALFERRRR